MLLARALEGARADEHPVRGEGRGGLSIPDRSEPARSRTVPFVAKAIGAPIAKIAARVMAGEKLANLAADSIATSHIAVKEAVFPVCALPRRRSGALPEMKSTGEVMGIDADFATAFAKSQLGAGPSCRWQARCSSR
jgi:carbamoylphosphate synthase large subunit